MSYERRSFAGAAVATTLANSISSGDTSIVMSTATGWPTGSAGDFFVVIGRGTSSEEKVRCSSRTGSNLAVATSGRGADGTSAAAHSAGEAIEHCITAVDANEANLAVVKTVGAVSAAGAILVSDAANSFAALDIKGNAKIVVGNGTTATSVAVSGDITIDNTGVATIANLAVNPAKIAADAVTTAKILDANVTTGKLANDAVTFAKMQNVATDSLVGRDTASTGDPENILLNATLSMDGSGNLQRAALTGDVTAPAGSNATTLADLAVLTAKLNDLAVTTGKLNDLAVTTGKLAAASVTAAKLATGLPQGYVTGATVSANQTGLGAGPTDITGLTITVTGDNVKRLRLSVKATFGAVGGAGQSTMFLQEGATVLDTAQWGTSAATDIYTSVIDYDFIPSVGSHTYKVTASKNAFDQDLLASSTNRARIYAEWIG